MVPLAAWWAVAVAGAGIGAWAWAEACEPGRLLRRARRLLDLAEQTPQRGLKTDLQVAAGFALARAIGSDRHAHPRVGAVAAVVLTGVLIAAPFWAQGTDLHGSASQLWTAVLVAFWLEAPGAWGYVAWVSR